MCLLPIQFHFSVVIKKMPRNSNAIIFIVPATEREHNAYSETQHPTPINHRQKQLQNHT